MKQSRRRSGGDVFGGDLLASAGLFALALLVALGLALSTITGSWTTRLALVVRPRLAGDVTVAVWGRGLESADAAVARAVESLSVLPNTRAIALEPDATDSLVGRLIGGGAVDADGPRLVSIQTGLPQASIAGSVERLRTAGITAKADDHRGANGALERRVIVAGTIAVGGTVLLCCVLFLAAATAAKTSVARHRQRIELMIRMGARRGFLAGRVRRQIGFRVLGGALVGLVVGEGLALLAASSGLNAMPPGSGPALVDGVAALAWAPLLFLIVVAGAGLGARGALKRAERVG